MQKKMFLLATAHNAPKLLKKSIDLVCDNAYSLKNLDLTANIPKDDAENIIKAFATVKVLVSSN